MSGGSYDYFCYKLEQFADDIRIDDTQTPEVIAARQKFAQHMSLAAKAARAIEWVDSDDNAPGDELDALNAYFATLEGK